jgi:hypothetical protein
MVSKVLAAIDQLLLTQDDRGSTDFLPTFSVPRQPILVTRELLASGRQGTVYISIIGTGPCADEAKKAETLVGQ